MTAHEPLKPHDYEAEAIELDKFVRENDRLTPLNAVAAWLRGRDTRPSSVEAKPCGECAKESAEIMRRARERADAATQEAARLKEELEEAKQRNASLVRRVEVAKEKRKWAEDILSAARVSLESLKAASPESWGSQDQEVLNMIGAALDLRAAVLRLSGQSKEGSRG